MKKFGPVSRSELAFFFTRAVVGAGCEFGIGEDVAKTAIWLGNVGLDPAIIISRSLDFLSSEACIKPKKDTIKNQIILRPATQNKMSAIYASIIAGDCLDATPKGRNVTICLKNLDNPLLAIAMLYARTKKNTFYQIYIDGLTDEMPPATILKAITENKDLSEITISLTATAQQNVHQNPDADIFVDDSAWRKIIAYFNKCLVPATAQSRLSGAGAGFSDND